MVLNISHNKEVLIFLSRGELDDKEGKTLHSISHGFRFESRRTSNPYISKQRFLFLEDLYMLFAITGSTERIDFISKSLILVNTSS